MFVCIYVNMLICTRQDWRSRGSSSCCHWRSGTAISSLLSNLTHRFGSNHFVSRGHATPASHTRRRKSIVLATQNDFRHVTRHACHAKRSNATFETSKRDPFCRTYHRHGKSDLARTVANGCEMLRTVARRRANTPSTRRPPEWNGNPCYAFGNKYIDM